MKYKEYKNLDLSGIAKDVLKFWKSENIFHKSIRQREGNQKFVFFEGPPSANGLPGIHHVISRSLKDLFCRYKTMKGFQVPRKSGWDTHGLPVELQVEKRLGIRKEDIGVKISVADYNEECRKDVMKYQDVWQEMTDRIGFWLDLEHPYITYDRKYIETIWHMLRQLYDKNLLYKGYTIQPYSPAAGTGLSSHELNQPGCYKMVKDISAVAQFKAIGHDNLYFLAWTTTPWTLPGNSALAIGEDINYAEVETFNPFSGDRIRVILAKDTLGKYFNYEAVSNTQIDEFASFGKELPLKNPPYHIIREVKGRELIGIKYEQLLPFIKPEKEAFRVIAGDFVETEEGTGIVHISPTFGADDMRVAMKNDIPPIMVADPDNPGKQIPIVDRTGKFVPQMGEFAGRYVKNYIDEESYSDVNVDIVIKLKKEGKIFRSEKFEHTYPHCWRTDKPVIYYPLESWFIRTTAYKDRMMELNYTINWKPASTGTGRFGNWLENLVDWNLSRSRYWGTPLPIWVTEDGEEIKCIGSIEELADEVEKAREAGFEQDKISKEFDPHRPYVDDVVLVSPSGKAMRRVTDVIDVWFDSGAMPYAQWHYPFENEDTFKENFPADFIAEGVDQTRGWFFTLHALAVMLHDSVAYKNVISNGLVLDKNGNKMSKRLGNTVDPFNTLEQYGPDATRWYMFYNSPPWDNLKFDFDSLDETRKKFFGTLYNVYSFFALYANIDGFKYSEERIAVNERQEIDRWIISMLNTLVIEVDESLADYDPTRAVRTISDFVGDNLSNWYVRLCRRRFWKGEYTEDKIAAYQTLYECLVTVAQLSASFAPFYMDQMFIDLNSVTGRIKADSVHLSDFPVADTSEIDKDLEDRMLMAQQIASLGLALRKKAKIKVRQPLNRILVAVMSDKMRHQLNMIKDLVISELNVKDMEYILEDSDMLVKKAKPDFKKLGPKYGPKMKEIQQCVASFTQRQIKELESTGELTIGVKEDLITIKREDVEILSEDIPGWLVETEGSITVALDISLSEELINEGVAREIVNRVQQIRKNRDFDVTDHISVKIQEVPELIGAVNQFKSYICSEILADELVLANDPGEGSEAIELNDRTIFIQVNRV